MSNNIDPKEMAKEMIVKLYSPFLKDILEEEVYQHSDRVCSFALAIAENYDLNLQEKIDIAAGSLLHDIGKSYVNQNVLYKVQKLTKDDRMLIECHPQLGYTALKNFNLNRNVIDIVHYHHERLDGSGYPEKLIGRKINLLTQIVSVADVYEALTADRVYHEKMTPEKAIETMRKDEGLNQVAVRILANIVLPG